MKKVGFIVLAVILALGLVGAAYAAFSQNLFAQANVQTGNVSVEWSGTYTTTSTGNNVGITADELGASIAYSQTSAPDDTATITVSNAYPGAWVEVTPVLYNSGNIPATVSISTVDSYALATTDLLASGADLNAGSITIAPGAYGTMAPFYVEVNPASQANGTTLYAQFTLNAVSP